MIDDTASSGLVLLRSRRRTEQGIGKLRNRLIVLCKNERSNGRCPSSVILGQAEGGFRFSLDPFTCQ